MDCKIINNSKRKFIAIVAIICLVGFYAALYTISSKAVNELENSPEIPQIQNLENLEPLRNLGNEHPDTATTINQPPQTSNLSRTTETLKNTNIDGQLDVDAQGNFIANKSALALFDYFLLAQGEIGEQAAIGYIHDYINANLKAPAINQALAFLDKYNAFREAARAKSVDAANTVDNLTLALNNINNTANNFSDVKAGHNELQALRHEFFGEALSQNLFDTQNERQLLQRLEVTMDSTLSDAQKQELLTSLSKQLPKADQDYYLEMQTQHTVSTKVDELKAAGASREEIYQYRKEVWGSEAADRLAALDERNSAWNERSNTFLNQKTQIENNSVMSDAQKTSAINNLLAQFSNSEQLRLGALEKIKQQP